MTQKRTDLGFGNALEDLASEPWQPARPATKPAPEVLQSAANAAGFQSRQATPAARPQRRHRTGRNVQFNLKARPETIDTFHQVADQEGWSLSETLECAVELLAQAHLRSKP